MRFKSPINFKINIRNKKLKKYIIRLYNSHFLEMDMQVGPLQGPF